MILSNFEIIEVIYRFMKVKGIGLVQTDRLLFSIKNAHNSFDIEQQIVAVLNDSQRNHFLNNDSISIF